MCMFNSDMFFCILRYSLNNLGFEHSYDRVGKGLICRYQGAAVIDVIDRPVADAVTYQP